jgi:hypothetical protein
MKITQSISTDNQKFRGLFFSEERNDCTVRALASAGDMRYKDAWSIAQDFGRKTGRGMSINDIVKMLKFNFIGVKYNSIKKTYVDGKKQVTTFAKLLKDPRFQTGAHYIIVTGHAFAIKDGVVYGNSNDGDRSRAHVKGWATLRTGNFTN